MTANVARLLAYTMADEYQEEVADRRKAAATRSRERRAQAQARANHPAGKRRR